LDTDNQVYNASNAYFSATEKFIETSKQIAYFLFEQSQHPKIKDGELYVVGFEGAEHDGKLCKALGIFKTETKDKFLKINFKENQGDLWLEEGIALNKIDKACIVLNLENETGCIVKAYDQIGKEKEVGFWFQDFLQIKPYKNNVFATKTYINLCKEFSEEVMADDENIATTEKIALLQNTVDYFTGNQSFQKSDFEKEVLKSHDLINKFNDFAAQAIDEPLPEKFDIEIPVVKNQKKYIKSVIKLDKNFHVYVHSKHDFIENGFDEDKGMKFYKLFYEQES
jgi:hypothetical protein